MAKSPYLRRTKIVATLGPASASPGTIAAMLDAGVDAVRLNFSHGDHGGHARLLENVRRASKRIGKSVPIIQDLQGPRFRLGRLQEDHLDLKPGQRVTLGTGPAAPGLIPIWPAFSGARPGHTVIIGDSGIALRVRTVRRGKIACRVIRGGRIRSQQGVIFPHARSTLPTLTAKDLDDLKFGIAQGVDFIALSFVRSASDIRDLRRRLHGADIGLIAKIETKEAVREIQRIIDVSDAILVARGDLASEISISDVPVLQKFLIEQSNLRAKPVVTATQMLESMISNPQPTRAEASDVANAVLDGSDALMLSGETAVGKYPVETVRMMASVIEAAERAHDEAWLTRKPMHMPEPEIDETIAYLAVNAARSLNAAAIITFTVSGSTALRVAKFRPTVPIFAVTPSAKTRLRLGLSYGTICEEIGEARDTDTMIGMAIAAARKRRIIRRGDTVAITAGVPPYASGKTNLLKIEVV